MEPREIKKFIKKYIVPTFDGTDYKLHSKRDIVSVNQGIFYGVFTRINSSSENVAFMAAVNPLMLPNDHGDIVLGYGNRLQDFIDTPDWFSPDEYDTEEIFTYFAEKFHEYFVPWLEARNTPAKIIADLSSVPDITKLSTYKQLSLIYSYAQLGDLKDLIETGSKIVRECYAEPGPDYKHQQKSEIQNLVKMAEDGDRKSIEKTLQATIDHNIKQFELEDFVS